MGTENERDAQQNNRRAQRLLPYLDSSPIQVMIPSTGKKLLGFLLDESADGAAIQLRRTRCLSRGDRIHVARNGRMEEAFVKHVANCGISSRIGLEWTAPLDDMALIESVGVRR